MNFQEYERIKAQEQIPELHPRTERPINKPLWLKSPIAGGQTLFGIKQDLRQKKLYTVCEEAKCPNIGECWNTGTATFMIMGDTCTRGCRFCHIKTGNPQGWLDSEEPFHVADSIASMHLNYAVITMVDRDDLPDGGAAHIARTLEAIHAQCPQTRVEILAGDFQGNQEALSRVIHAGRGLDVFAHNVETVRRLSPRVRDARAKYAQSLDVLAQAKTLHGQGVVGSGGVDAQRGGGTAATTATTRFFTKSAIMLGLGEEGEEIYETLQDLRRVGVDIVTIGQYLQPTPKHLKVKRFAHPDEFLFWEQTAKELGFLGVASGPLVRSSYKANHLFPR